MIEVVKKSKDRQNVWLDVDIEAKDAPSLEILGNGFTLVTFADGRAEMGILHSVNGLDVELLSLSEDELWYILTASALRVIRLRPTGKTSRGLRMSRLHGNVSRRKSADKKYKPKKFACSVGTATSLLLRNHHQYSLA